MSDMEIGKRQKGPTGSFTADFKAGAVRLVLEEGNTIPQVARDLDLTESSVRGWVRRGVLRLAEPSKRPGRLARGQQLSSGIRP